jgi:hypothetical protein
LLSEEEKREMRDMAVSARLREEFRTMRRNSQAIERRIGVNELAHWSTAMARVCPGGQETATLDSLYRRKVVGTAGQIWKDDREAINFYRLKCEISEPRSTANVSSRGETG